MRTLNERVKITRAYWLIFNDNRANAETNESADKSVDEDISYKTNKLAIEVTCLPLFESETNETADDKTISKTINKPLNQMFRGKQ